MNSNLTSPGAYSVERPALCMTDTPLKHAVISLSLVELPVFGLGLAYRGVIAVHGLVNAHHQHFPGSIVSLIQLVKLLLSSHPILLEADEPSVKPVLRLACCL